MIYKGVVVKSTGSSYIVELSDGSRIDCRFKGKFKIKGISSTNPVVVGDKVELERIAEKDTGMISKIFPRNNYIVRKSIKLSKLSHVIASNIDNAFIIASLISPRTSSGFIDRILFTAEAYHINPIIVFNKIDLYDDEHYIKLREIESIYSNAGYKFIEISALRGDNIEGLKQLMQGKVNMVVGHSGVGKSAIINILQPGINLKTTEISAMHDKGKHTTTFAEMHKLSFGGYIIDTPGVGEFSVIDFNKAEVAGYFPELFAVIKDCRFKNCIHINEPGCAVKDAVEKGKISISRYNSYLSIMASDETEINYQD